MRARTLLMTAALVPAAALLVLDGCGDDDVATPKQDAGTSAEAAATSDAPPLYDAGVDAGPMTCGATPCAPGDYRGLASLPACCTPSGGCGLDLRPAAKWESVGETCTPLANPGVADDLCPTYTRGDEDGGIAVFERQGCCMPDETCGVFVKLGEIDLGCVPTKDYVVDAGATPISCARDASKD